MALLLALTALCPGARPAPSAAQDEAPESSEVSPALPGLPGPVAADHFAALLESSPFTRSLNQSDSLILTGIATMDGKRVATLMNRETKETYVVSEEPNPQGWRMVEVDGSADLEKVAAKVSVSGGEVVTVRYDDWSLKPGEAKPASGGGGEIRESGPRGSGDQGRGGPSPEIRERMEALSEDKRRLLFDHMTKLRMENPEMSWEERSAVFRQALERAERAR